MAAPYTVELDLPDLADAPIAHPFGLPDCREVAAMIRPLARELDGLVGHLGAEAGMLSAEALRATADHVVTLASALTRVGCHLGREEREAGEKMARAS